MSNLKKTAFKSDVDSKIYNNNSRAISGSIHNAVLKNVADSFLFYIPVASTAARNAIVEGDRYQGILVYVASEERYYFGQSDLSTWNKILTQGDIQTLIDASAVGVNGRIFDAVADLTAAKAINTTDVDDWPDNGVMVVKTLGTYRLDRSSSAAGDNNRVIQPTTGVGRWLKIASTIFDHNELFNAQGGTTNQYYHLTQAQHSVIQDTINKRHSQNTDQYLDYGGENQVSAAQLKDIIDSGVGTPLIERLYQIKFVSSDYQITTSDKTILVSVANGPVEITLPSVVGSQGYDFDIKKIDDSENIVSIIPSEINGSISISMSDFIAVEFDGYIELTIQGEVANLKSDGNDWYLIA